VEYTYAVFLSYSHADRRIAEWLHKSLERYSIQAPGAKPRRFGKVFRDEVDLSAGESLASGIEAALQQSRVLVVLASPRAAQSPYVALEIERFRQLGRGNQIFFALADGEPNAALRGFDPAIECLPEAVRLGTEVRLGAEPLAADLRRHPSFHRHELAKLVAGIENIPLDALLRREDASARTRRNLIIGAVVGAVGLVAGITSTLTAARISEAQTQLAEATEREARAQQLTQLGQEGFWRVFRLGDMDAALESAPETASLLEARAVMRAVLFGSPMIGTLVREAPPPQFPQCDLGSPLNSVNRDARGQVTLSVTWGFPTEGECVWDDSGRFLLGRDRTDGADPEENATQGAQSQGQLLWGGLRAVMTRGIEIDRWGNLYRVDRHPRLMCVSFADGPIQQTPVIDALCTQPHTWLPRAPTLPPEARTGIAEPRVIAVAPDGRASLVYVDGRRPGSSRNLDLHWCLRDDAGETRCMVLSAGDQGDAVVAMHPSGNAVAFLDRSTSSRAESIWILSEGRVIAELPATEEFAFSADGRFLQISFPSRGRTEMWDMQPFMLDAAALAARVDSLRAAANQQRIDQTRSWDESEQGTDFRIGQRLRREGELQYLD